MNKEAPNNEAQGDVDGDLYNPPGNLFQIEDPPSQDASPEAEGAKSTQDTSGEAGNDGNGLGQDAGEGLGEATNNAVPEVLAKHGFKTVEDMERSWLETKQKNTELSNTVSTLEKQSQEQAEAKKNELPYSQEQLDELYNSDRAKYEQALEENLSKKLSQRFGIDALSDKVENLSADNMLNALRSKHSDFRNYEGKIAQEASKLGEDGARFLTSQGLEMMYEHIKMKEQLNELNDKKAQTEEAKKNTKDASKAAAAGAGGGGGTPDKTTGKPGDGEKVNIEGIGSVDRDQLSLVQGNPFLMNR